jgi:hypothetical protein
MLNEQKVSFIGLLLLISSSLLAAINEIELSMMVFEKAFLFLLLALCIENKQKDQQVVSIDGKPVEF